MNQKNIFHRIDKLLENQVNSIFTKALIKERTGKS